MDDVVDTIGPSEDPSITDCIAALAGPVPMPGCTIDDFWIDAMPGLPTEAELLSLQRNSREHGLTLAATHRR